MATTWTGRPAYQQLADELRLRIQRGSLRAGDQLPSLAELMKEHEVSITVVRMAFNKLREEGLIETHQGKGAFVQPTVGATAENGDSDRVTQLVNELVAVREQLGDLSERVGKLETASRAKGRGR